MNKTKKGFFLAEETLKIVIAVIVIVFLIYFVASLYFSAKDTENLKFAEQSLKYLTDQIGLKTAEIQIYNPTGWSILSWPFENKLPLSCSNLGWEKCLCICKKPLLANNANYLDNCEQTGSKAICAESNFTVIGKGGAQIPIIIENPPLNLGIDYDNKKISQ